VDEPVIGTRFLGELARRDIRVAVRDQKPLGGVEKGLLGVAAGGRYAEPPAR